jgi:heptaprenyl diphosphate synthase
MRKKTVNREQEAADGGTKRGERPPRPSVPSSPSRSALNARPAVRVARAAALLGLALAFSYLESLVILLPHIPGAKLGLANIAVLLLLYTDGFWLAGTVSVLRVVTAGLLFNGIPSIAFGLTGAVLSLCAMFPLIKTRRFGVTGVSVAGGACHNIGQIIVARIVLGSDAVFEYLPFLIVAGMGMGLLVGVIVWLVLKQLRYDKAPAAYTRRSE